MRTMIRAGALAAVACLAGFAGVSGIPAARAQVDEEQTGTVAVLSGRAVVRADESVENVFVADGPVVIDGRVRNRVVALNGDVVVRGVVEEYVVAADGRVTITPTGRVDDDVISRHRPTVEPGGRFGGEWQKWNPRAWGRGAAIFTRLAVWVAFTVSTVALGLVLGALAPRTPEAVHRAARERIGPVIGWGFVVAIGVPVSAALVTATIVGLPLGLAVLFALGLIYVVGYTASAWVLGRSIAPRTRPILSFLAGWGILRVVALIPFVGGLSWIAAVIFGLGAIAVAGYRARTPAPVPPARPAPAPPPPA